MWEDVNDPERNFISARPEGGSWRTLGTIPLPLTDGVSSSGRFRYGDITLAVPLPEQASAPTATPTPTPTVTPTTQATTVTVSETGPSTARMRLVEGIYICELTVRDNLKSGFDGLVQSRHINADSGEYRRIVNDFTDGGDGQWSRVFSLIGGDYFIEVSQVEQSAEWTARCIPEGDWVTGWRARGGKEGFGTGSSVSVLQIDRSGVHVCTTTVSNNSDRDGSNNFFEVEFAAGASVTGGEDLTESGSWEKVLQLDTGIYYIQATSSGQSSQWSVECE